MDVDVLIVGGGPAGLSTAQTVASAGYRVLVVERQPTIGEHVRTSGVTALETVARLGCPTALRHELHRMRFSTLDDDVVLEFDVRPFCVLDVRGFYRWLALSAMDAGAEILTGGIAKRVLSSGGVVAGCSITVGSDEVGVAAQLIVDAGGYRATISKAVSLHPGFSRFGVGAEYELQAPNVAQDEAVLILSEQFAPSGYGWSFPWGEDRVRLGVGIHHSDVRTHPREQLGPLRASAGKFGLDLRSATTHEHHFGLVPAERTPDRLVADGVVAVGDAAGQATLVVGEGIRTAIRAGEIAGDAIVVALARQDVSRRQLQAYEDRFQSEFGRELRLGRIINSRLSTFGDADWSAVLQLLRTMPSHVVSDILESRFSTRQLLRWFARHPRRAIQSRTLVRAALTR